MNNINEKLQKRYMRIAKKIANDLHENYPNLTYNELVDIAFDFISFIKDKTWLKSGGSLY